MQAVLGIPVQPENAAMRAPTRDPDGKTYSAFQAQTGNRQRIEIEFRCRLVDHRHFRTWGQDVAAQNVSGPAPALLTPMVVIPNLVLGFEEQRWVYQFSLPPASDPEPIFMFFGWVNFVVQTPIVNCANFDMYFWRKPMGATQYQFLPGWRWAVVNAPATWYQSSLPAWTPLLVYQGDQFGISIRPIGGSFLNPQPFAVDLR